MTGDSFTIAAVSQYLCVANTIMYNSIMEGTIV